MGGNDMMELAQRIAVLETRANQSSDDNEDIKNSIHQIQATLNEMREELSKYRGFWGGALLVVGALWTFVTFAWDWILKQLKGES